MRFFALLLVSCARVPTYVNDECVGTYDKADVDKMEEHTIACMDIGPKTDEWVDTCIRSSVKLYCKHELVVHYNDHTTVQCKWTPQYSAGRDMCNASGWKERP